MTKFQIALLLLLFWSLCIQLCMLVLLLAVVSSVVCATDMHDAIYSLCRFFP